MYHRNHVTRFLEQAEVPMEERTEIVARMEDAIGRFDDETRQNFSGGAIQEVLGSPELYAQFNNLWENGDLDHA